METYICMIWVFQLFKLVAGSAERDIQECGGKKADIMFVLDTSGSISYDDFRKELNFTKDVISMFDVNSNKTHVGIINFSTQVKQEVRLGEVNDKEEILNRISTSQILYQGGGTHTDKALRLLWSSVFVPGVMRPDVAHIAIILTDGMSYNMAKTKAEAKEAKRRGITLFVIGIGNEKNLDEQELTDIASVPTGNFMFRIANFDALKSIETELATKACEQRPAPTIPPTLPPVLNDNGETVCVPSDPMNLVFAFDISGIGTENAKFVLQFIHNMSSIVPQMSERMTVSVISGGCGIRDDGSNAMINNAHSTKEIDRSLDQLSVRAFNSIMRKLRLQFNRRARNKVGILFLDKQLGGREYFQSKREAKYAAFQKIDIYVVGVGDRVDDGQAQKLTTGGKHYFHTDRYEMLDSVKDTVLCAISSFS